MDGPAPSRFTQDAPESPESSESSESPAPQDLQPGDFYPEGPYMVFTAQYHLRRGFCCNSGCRHCPYS